MKQTKPAQTESCSECGSDKLKFKHYFDPVVNKFVLEVECLSCGTTQIS